MSVPVVTVAGRMDGATVAELERQAVALADGHPRLVLDLVAVSHMGTHELSALIATLRRLTREGMRFDVACDEPMVCRTFALADVDGVALRSPYSGASTNTSVATPSASS